MTAPIDDYPLNRPPTRQEAAAIITRLGELNTELAEKLTAFSEILDARNPDTETDILPAFIEAFTAHARLTNNLTLVVVNHLGRHTFGDTP